MAGPATLYQTGNHAGRPAAGSGCVLYTCTDHNLVYRDDGSSWSTFITLASGIADTTFNAKGDILSASADDTPAILSVGANGSILRAASGQSTGLEWQKNNLAATAAPGASDDNTAGYSVGSAWFDTTNDEVYFAIDVSTGAAVWKQVGSGGGGISSGSSFPGGPSTNDLFYRTDDAELYYYTGSAWHSVASYHVNFWLAAESQSGITVTATSFARSGEPYGATDDVYLLDVQLVSYVATTNNGSNYWGFDFRDLDTAGATASIATDNTSADSANTYTRHSIAVNTAMASDAIHLYMVADKTGSPGTLYARSAMLRFRRIGT